MNILYGYLISYFYVFGVLFVVSIIKKISKIKQNDIFRKSVHILIVFTWLPLYFFLYGTWHFIVIPLTFVLINAVSAKYSLIKIVERDDGKKKEYRLRAHLICHI